MREECLACIARYAFESYRPVAGSVCLCVMLPLQLTTLQGLFFTQQVISMWNDLPEEKVCAASKNSFKNGLDKAGANTDYTCTITRQKCNSPPLGVLYRLMTSKPQSKKRISVKCEC